jgi:hypothetical protein
MPGCEQSLSHQDHQRRLARSAHAQIAHTQHGAAQTAGFEPPAPIGEVA